MNDTTTTNKEKKKYEKLFGFTCQSLNEHKKNTFLSWIGQNKSKGVIRCAAVNEGANDFSFSWQYLTQYYAKSLFSSYSLQSKPIHIPILYIPFEFYLPISKTAWKNYSRNFYRFVSLLVWVCVCKYSITAMQFMLLMIITIYNIYLWCIEMTKRKETNIYADESVSTVTFIVAKNTKDFNNFFYTIFCMVSVTMISDYK